MESTIQQLIESKTKANQTNDVDDKDTHLLTTLLSQVESLKVDSAVKSSEQPSVQLNQVPTDTVDGAEIKNPGEGETRASGSDAAGDGAEDVVVKELKKLERQNRTTHWLLSALIFITVAWQISEVSLLLKLKGYLTHPFKSLGSMVTGVIKPPEPDEEESME